MGGVSKNSSDTYPLQIDNRHNKVSNDGEYKHNAFNDKIIKK